MDSKEAEKKLCPFRFGRPSGEDQIGALKHIDYEDLHCITFKCMAWELTEIQARYKDGKTSEEIQVTDNGYCALIRTEAIEGFVMPHSQKTRAW